MKFFLNPIPIVIVNRDSERYSTVSSNDLLLVEKAVAMFAEKEMGNIAVIAAKNPSSALGIRTHLFIEMARASGMYIDRDSIRGHGTGIVVTADGKP